MEEVFTIPKRQKNATDFTTNNSITPDESKEFVKKTDTDYVEMPDYLKQYMLTVEGSNFVDYTKNQVLANMGNNLYGNSISKVWDVFLHSASHIEAAAHGKLAPASPKDVVKSMEQYQKWAKMKDTTDKFNKKTSQGIINKIVNFGANEESPPIETEEDFQNAIEMGVNNIEAASGQEFSMTYGDILNEEKSNILNTAFADIDTLRVLADIDNSSSSTPITNFLKKWKKKTGASLDNISQEAKEKIALADAHGDMGLVKKLASVLTAGTVDVLTDPFKLMSFNAGTKSLESLVTSTLAKHVVVGTGFSAGGVVANWIYSEDNYTMEEAAIDFAAGIGFYAAPMVAAYGVKGAFKGGKLLKDLVVKPNPKINKSYRDFSETAWDYNTSNTNAAAKASESGVNEPTGKGDFSGVKILNEDQTAFISLEKNPPVIQNVSEINEKTGIKLNSDGSDFEFIGNQKINPTPPVKEGVNIPIETKSIPRTTEEIQESIRKVTKDTIKERSSSISALRPDQMPKALQEAGKGIGRIQANLKVLNESQTLDLRATLLKDRKYTKKLVTQLDPKSRKYDKELEKKILHAVITENETDIVNLPQEARDIARGYITANKRNIQQQHSVGIVKTKAENYSSPKFTVDKLIGQEKEFVQDSKGNIDWKLMQKRELEKLTNDAERLKRDLTGKNKEEITKLEKKIKTFGKKGYTDKEKNQITTGYYKSLIDSAHKTWTVEGQMSNVERKNIFIRPDKFAEYSRKWGDDVSLLRQMDNKLEKDAMQTAIHNELGYAPSEMIDMYLEKFRDYREKGAIAKFLPGNYYQDLINLRDAFTAKRRIPEAPNKLDKILSVTGAVTQALQLRNVIRYSLIEEVVRASLLNKAFGRNKSENLFSMVAAHFIKATPEERAILSESFHATNLPGRRDTGNLNLNDSSRNDLPRIIGKFLNLGAHSVTQSNKRSATLYFQHLSKQFLAKDINKLTKQELKDLSRLDIDLPMLRWAKKHEKEASYILNNPFGGNGGELISFSSTYNKYLQASDTKNSNMALKWLTSAQKAVDAVVPESQSFQEFAARGNPGTQGTLSALLKYNPIMYLTGAARNIGRAIADLNDPGFYSLNTKEHIYKLASSVWEWHETNLMIGMAIDHLKQFAQGDLTDTEEMTRYFLDSDFDKMSKKMLSSYSHAQMVGGMIGWFGEIALASTFLAGSMVTDPKKSFKQKGKEAHLVNDFVSPAYEGILKSGDVMQNIIQLFGSESPEALSNLKKDLLDTSRGDMKDLPLDILGVLGTRFIVDKLLPMIDDSEMIKAMQESAYNQRFDDATEARNKKDKASRQRAGKNMKRKDFISEK